MKKAKYFYLLRRGFFGGGGGQSFFDQFGTPAAAYSLRDLSGSNPNVIEVRRSSDDATNTFTPAQILSGALTDWVNGADNEVMDNPDITSATGWNLGGNTTYNATTEAFDLAGETGLTVRQSKSLEGITYEVTFVISSYTTGSLRIYAGGNQSVSFSGVGTHTATIVGGSANDFMALNPTGGAATLSISSFSAIQKTANGHVRTLYDQAGANDATQTTAVNQPLIVDAGVLVEENGLPAISFDGTDDFITSSLSGAAVSDSYFVMNYDNDAKAMSYTDLYTNDTGRYSAFVDSGGSNADLSYGTPSYYVNGVLKTITTRSEALNELSNGKGQILRVDQGADTSTWQDLQFGLWFTGFAYSGTLQEFVIYQEDKSSDRTDIETNINDHYSIY